MPRFRRPVLLLCVLAVHALPGCIVVNGAGSDGDWSGSSWTQESKEREERQFSVAHVAGSPLVVDTFNGDVKIIRGGTDTVSIKAFVSAKTRDALARVTTTAVREADGRLVVRAERPPNSSSDRQGCAFEITIPACASASISTSNGLISVEHASGDVTAESSNGAITVSDVGGKATLDTSNGAIVASRVAGAIVADTSNGEVRIVDAGGPVRADSSNGAISVELLATNAGPVVADTSNGSITLVIGPSFAGQLDADTSNGSFTVSGKLSNAELNVGKRSGRITFATPGERSVLDASNGSITVRAR